MREAVEKIIAASKDKDTDDYAHDFWAAADAAKKQDNLELARTLVHLGDACSMYMKPENVAEPFGPMAVFEGGKSTAHPGSVSDQMVETLRAFSTPETDPELRARCADLVWLVKRDHKMAVVAIDAYLESAKRLHSPDHWVGPGQRIERAYRLAASINHKASFEAVSAYAKQLLADFDGKDPLYFTAHLLEMLAERRDGDARAYAALAEKAAKNAQSGGDHHRAQRLWNIAATWRTLAKDETGKDAAALEAAREHTRLADQAKAAGSATNEAAHLSDAVTALKRARAPTEEIETVHKRLLEVQPEARKNMRAIAVSVPLGDMPRQARARVSGKPLPEALKTLASLTGQPREADLRAEVVEERKRHPLMHLFHKTLVNQDGKVVARAPGVSHTDKDEDEEAIQGAMAHKRFFHHGMIAAAIIQPARETIALEHQLRLRDLAPLVQGHPFVPPGHEAAWAKVLYFGLAGDLETAMHFLAPQIEASIRFVLATHGVIVTGHDDNGIQEEIPLHKLIEKPEFSKLFGSDATADMRFLLVDRQGYNLRNRVGHGLADEGELSGTEALYAWWIGVRLIMSQIEFATPKPEPAGAANETELAPDTELHPDGSTPGSTGVPPG